MAFAISMNFRVHMDYNLNFSRKSPKSAIVLKISKIGQNVRYNQFFMNNSQNNEDI